MSRVIVCRSFRPLYLPPAPHPKRTLLMAGQNPRRPVYARHGLMMYTVGSIDSMHMMYARHFKPHGYRLFCVRMQHKSVRRFVKLVEHKKKSLPAARFCTVLPSDLRQPPMQTHMPSIRSRYGMRQSIRSPVTPLQGTPSSC